MLEQRVIDMIKHHEGVKAKWYYCPANLITQGVGHVLYPEQARLPFAERRNFKIRPEDDRIWTMAEILPSIAALFTIVWTGFRIYETDTVQGWLKKGK